jgi:hypothetical protein
MNKIKQAIWRNRRAREYEWIKDYIKRYGEHPSGGLMGRVMGYTHQRSWQLLKEYKQLFK